MSETSEHDDVVDITLRLRGLVISIQGPSGPASQLVSEITGSSSAPASGIGSGVPAPGSVSGSPAPSSGGYSLARGSLVASFPPCSDQCLSWSSRLGGSTQQAERRIQRAWTAGCWARAVLDGEIRAPARTPELDIRSRFYVILRAQGISTPVIYSNSTSYWSTLGGEHEDSVSHSFPSETEARTYCLAAGVQPPPTRA
eukprot:Skav215491  [mRNA]  locus=scaffold165:477291:477887:+ [translate_table: standard]